MNGELKSEQSNEDVEEENRRIEQSIHHLLICMYCCCECMKNYYTTNSKHEHCCIDSVFIEAVPRNFPIDIISITQSYLLSNVSRSWLTTPLDQSLGVIQCYILKTNSQFDLYLEISDQKKFLIAKERLLKRRNNELQCINNVQEKETNNYSIMSLDERLKQNSVKKILRNNAKRLIMNGEDVFLLSAKRRRSLSGNKYIISMKKEKENNSTDSSSYLGKLKSNITGTKFVLYGYANKKTSIGQLSSVLYDRFLGYKYSPIRMKVLLPNEYFEAKSIIKQFKLESKKIDADQKENKNVQNVKANSSIDTYENQQPMWHDGVNGYVLNFDNNRVRQKSTKNFKLFRSDDDTKRTILQFGRVLNANLFVIDFSFPLSPLQAFAICLSSIDHK